jgi:hypothetical protein
MERTRSADFYLFFRYLLLLFNLFLNTKLIFDNFIGSIAAQKLLFGYSVKGDLLPYFSGHFDTTIGT